MSDDENPMAEISTKELLRMHRHPISDHNYTKENYRQVIEDEILRRAVEAL